MEPREYLPYVIEREYVAAHPDITEAGRAILREQIARRPEKYALSDRTRALLIYARARQELLDACDALEDEEDDDAYDRKREAAFRACKAKLYDAWQTDRDCVEAQLLDIVLSEAPIEDCVHDLVRLEHEVRARLTSSSPRFSPDAEHLWLPDGDGNGPTAAEEVELTRSDPAVIGWLHTLEALALACMDSARYRLAARYARQAMRARSYTGHPEGTLLLALARLEDEQGFFDAVRDYDAAHAEGLEASPWFLLARALLLYKLGRRKPARRALLDFAGQAEGGAYFLLNPDYDLPYVPVRPAPREPWDLSLQAVSEADPILVDTPDFTDWAESLEGVERIAEHFADQHGF